MGAWVVRRLRRRWGRALVAVLVLVAVAAPIGIWRLVEWKARSATIVTIIIGREGNAIGRAKLLGE